MANYTGPKVRLSRRVGVAISDTPKHTSKRQLTPPGQHGFRGRRLRDYGIRLQEKQKLRYHYNVMEKQFRGLVDEAVRRTGNSGQILIQLLEQRLDNVVRRMGVARTIWSARQVVAHGHVLVNGKKVDRPSYQIKPGDVVTFKEKSQKVLRENMESLAGYEVPDWIDFNPGELKGTVAAAPSADHCPLEINTNLVIEFYR